MRPGVIEFLTSDAAILVVCGAGLVATALSIVRDARETRASRRPKPFLADSPVPDRLRDAA